MENIKINAIVNFAKPYRVAEGGSTNEGITINYLVTDTLKPYVDDITQAQGFKSTKSSLPLSLWDKLTSVPGRYELECELGVGSTGQPQLKPVDIHFLSYVDVVFSDTLSGQKTEPEQKNAESAEKASEKTSDKKAVK